MSQAGVFCLVALVVLTVFATCSAVSFPRRKLSQACFETFGVLCVTLLLLLGTLKSIPPEAFFPKQHKTPAKEEAPLWWRLRPGPFDYSRTKRLPA
jgi:hypothetical protein